MKNKALIKTISYIGLVCGFSSIFLNGIYSPTAPRVEASISPNATPVTEITLNQNFEASEVRTDMDEEGNQYYVWRRHYVNDLLETCNGIYYQAYNRSGIPLTQETLVEESCDVGLDYQSPDISVNSNNFMITYLEEEAGTFSVKTVVYSKYYFEQHAIQTINSGLDLDSTARPRIASSPDGTQSGVVFQACDNFTCTTHDIYFQGFDSLYEKAHLNNEIINDNTVFEQSNANISFSGDHFLIVFQDTFYGELDVYYSIYAKAVNYDASNFSPQISIENNAAQTPDVGGTIDNDYSGTPPYLESFYVTYLISSGLLLNEEIDMKKVYCEYDPGNPSAYYCDTTSRNGETVFVRVSPPDDTTIKTSPQVAVFKNQNDLKRSYPYENTNIDYLTVGWGQTDNYDRSYWKAQHYTNTLSTSGEMINLADDVSLSENMSLASSRDGHFVATYALDPSSEIKADIYPTQFLRVDHEKLVNAPDSNAQEKAKVAKNSNGDYIITYQSFNGTDYDIHFALYNKYGDPIKNTTIANTTLAGDQMSPAVAYWNEASDSENYGKFIIAWSGNGSGDSDGIFYQIFNQDGTLNGGETLVNQNTSYLQDSADLSTGHYGQFAIIYREENTGLATIVLCYKNETNTIYTPISATAADVRTPLVGINPIADGTTGTGGNSKLFTTWRDDNSGYIADGYLGDATTITMNATTDEGAFYSQDIDGAYNITNASFTPALNPFYYARTGNFVGEVGSGPLLVIGYYGSAYTETEPLDSEWTGNSVSVDPATQNIFVIGQKLAEYVTNGTQVLTFAANAPSSLSSEQIYDSNLQTKAIVSEGHGTYIFLTDVLQWFSAQGDIGTANPYTVTSTNFNKILEFATDISTHFSLSQVVTETTYGGSGTVVGIGTNHINLENTSGLFSSGGGTLDNAPYNDSYNNIPDTNSWDNVHFNTGEALNFEANNRIANTDLSTNGEIKYVYPDLLAVRMFNFGNFGASEELLDFNYTDTAVTDPIEYISGSFYRFSIDSGTNTADWIKAGPTFSVSEKSYYGQTFSSADAAFDTSSTDDIGKFVATAYSTSSAPDYIDANGIYQQMIEDPFSPGQKEDLSPSTEQQINPGGKYIIVPQTIDFGVINRNESSTVDLADLTPSCIRITDLDGTDFDLTVSLTDLTHTTQNGLIISKDNFIIENNDGESPLISNLAPFSSVDDVNLSPSTNPGENANLGTVQTLLTKDNPNTGSWKICPRTQLNIPSDANSGTYSGTLTFTLI